MGIAAPSKSPAMIASSGNPGSPGSGTIVVVSVVLVSSVVLELVSDELVELDVSLLTVDVVVADSVVAEDVVVEVLVVVVSMSILCPQLTSVPNQPAAQPSSDAMKLAL